MHGTSFNENSFNNNDNCFHEEEEEIPPPLPRKRNSLPRCPTYENVPRPDEGKGYRKGSIKPPGGVFDFERSRGGLIEKWTH